MKGIKLSLVAVLTAGFCTVSSADSLADAFKNGKTSGEVAVTYEMRKQDKELPLWGNYYQDSSYAMGSFALKYETAVWNNLSLTSKFRAYHALFEDDKDSSTWKGTGDATERFWEKDGTNRVADVEELFVTYKNGNVTAKLGRQFIASDWFGKTHDGVKIDAKFGDTSLEAIWSKRIGRIYARDYRPMTDINENKGAYKVGITHKFNDTITATAYDVILPDDHQKIGAKVKLNLPAGVGLQAHYVAKKMDDSSAEDSSFMDFKVSKNILGVNTTLGYSKVDKDAAFDGYAAAGEIQSPFEEGDMYYYRDARTIYASLSKSFGKLNATLLYGNFDYKYDTEKSYKSNETTLWLGYPVAKNLKANLGFTVFKADKDDSTRSTDMNQLNATLVYSF